MTDQEFISITSSSSSMAEACSKIGVHFNTFKRRAIKLNCYVPNQGGKNTKKKWMENRSISLNEILDGKHPQYQTYKLKHRLFKEGIKTNRCEECEIECWNGKSIECELDHIDGNSNNHILSNLRILCPNCHSQTETFRAKNIASVVERNTQLT